MRSPIFKSDVGFGQSRVIEYNKNSLLQICIFVLICFPAILFGQGNPVFLDEADLRDEALLQATLSATISPEDIRASEFAQDLAEKQADEMTLASQRRVQRMETRIKATPAGEDLGPLLDQMHLRIETAKLVISRAALVKQIVQAARSEQSTKAALNRGRSMEKFGGNGRFNATDLTMVERAFARKFGRTLPISADGDTSLHRALGLDHTGRVDVAVSPDQAEGVWLRKYLETLRIPYYAFRKAVIGSATAPHIHIGPPSLRHTSDRRQTIGIKTGYIPESPPHTKASRPS